MVKMIKNIYIKYQEVINYLIVGFLTFVVSIISYKIFKDILCINYIISNILSWIVAVLFAYVANRKYVFYSYTKDKEKAIEFINFIKYRLLSLGIETLLIYILVDIISINDDVSKIIGQVVVIILNYLFSKFLTFK